MTVAMAIYNAETFVIFYYSIIPRNCLIGFLFCSMFRHDYSSGQLWLWKWLKLHHFYKLDNVCTLTKVQESTPLLSSRYSLSTDEYNVVQCCCCHHIRPTVLQVHRTPWSGTAISYISQLLCKMNNYEHIYWITIEHSRYLWKIFLVCICNKRGFKKKKSSLRVRPVELWVMGLQHL